MTDDEVPELLRRGNEALTEARRLFDEALQGAGSAAARRWASHMAALLADGPAEKLRLNEMSLDSPGPLRPPGSRRRPASIRPCWRISAIPSS
jgi:hypothetical protein